MKITNEMRVGALAVFTLGLFIWGFNFLKGRNLFKSTQTFYAEYSRTEGLAKSALVVINGLKVGTVSDMHFKEDGSGKIIVVLTVEAGIPVPKETIARIKAPDFMGAKMVSLEYHTGCSATDDACLAHSGDVLRSDVVSTIESMLGVSVDPIVGKTDSALVTINSILKSLDTDPSISPKGAAKDVRVVISNLKTSTDNINKLVAASTIQTNLILQHLAAVTGNIEKSNADIQATIRNSSALTAKLNNLPLDQTVGGANATIAKLQITLDKANETIAALTETVNRAQKGNGTLAMLINDRKLYDDLAKTNTQIQLLTEDIRLHPERYRTLLSGKYKPYISPASTTNSSGN